MPGVDEGPQVALARRELQRLPVHQQDALSGDQLVAGVRLAVGGDPGAGPGLVGQPVVVAHPAIDRVQALAQRQPHPLGVRTGVPGRGGTSFEHRREGVADQRTPGREAGRGSRRMQPLEDARVRLRGLAVGQVAGARDGAVDPAGRAQCSAAQGDGEGARLGSQAGDHELQAGVEQCGGAGVRPLERLRRVPRLQPVQGDEEPALATGGGGPVVGAEADRQVHHLVDLRVPGRADRLQDIGVADVAGSLAHPVRPSRSRG